MDRRIEKTNRAIRKAFFELFAEKDITRITVSEIARRADIDRKTFYLHYARPEDILREFINEQIDELVSLLRQTEYFEQPLRVELIFRAVNDILDRNLAFYRRLAELNELSYLIDRMRRMMADALMNVYTGLVNVPEQQFSIYCSFFVSGLIQIYLDYLRRRSELTPEDIARVVTDIALQGVSGLFADLEAGT